MFVFAVHPEKVSGPGSGNLAQLSMVSKENLFGRFSLLTMLS